jgi:hypothetical protein
MPVIEIDEVIKRYRDVTAVDDVSTRVQPGRIYALLGLNGPRSVIWSRRPSPPPEPTVRETCGSSPGYVGRPFPRTT